jgi:hypothetical protein
MTQRNTQPQALLAPVSTYTSHDVIAALLRTLPLAAALILVLVLITVQSGAGNGFA